MGNKGRSVLEDAIVLHLERGHTFKDGKFVMKKKEELPTPKKQPLSHIILYCAAIMVASVIAIKVALGW